MREPQALQDVSPEGIVVDEKTQIPVWLVMVYVSLLTWSVWNILKYWD